MNPNKVLFILLILLLGGRVGIYSQHIANGNYKIIDSKSLISKNFYFLSLLANDTLGRDLIENDPVLSTFAQNKLLQISRNSENSEPLSGLQLTDEEIHYIGNRLVELYETNPILGKILKNHIYPSGVYCIYNNLDEKELLYKIWEQDAKGMNRFIDVYGKGVKPKYALIDSIDFNIHDKAYHPLLSACRQYIKDASSRSNLFFAIPIHAFLTLSDINDRYESIDFEPMEQTVNKEAYEAIRVTDFQKYPYSIILVLGAGPDKIGVPLSPLNKIRLRTAAIKYQEGNAPFVVVSGGRVHPFKTIYSEAGEMKRFLIEKCNLPEEAIIMEPHTRHTTTNIRNTVRIMFRQGIPLKKAAIVSSDTHIDYIAGEKQAELFNKRCLEDMGIIPHRLGQRIDETSVEFYPQIESLYINPNDPLDP